MLAYNLNKQIEGQKILSDIQKLVSSHNGPKNNLVLVIQLKNSIPDNSSEIPKIEYKPEE